MFSFFDWDKLYDQTLETRQLTLLGELAAVELPTNVWAWLDHFRNGQPIEEFAADMLQTGRESGNSSATALGVYVDCLIESFRIQDWDDGPFASANAAKLEEALCYLPHVNDCLTARDTPDHWWEVLWTRSAGHRTRILAFDGDSRSVTLPQRAWMLLDLFDADRGDIGLDAYIARGDNEPERVARALCALAKMQFERMRKDGTHPLFQPAFKDQIATAARQLDEF